ncbi:MAG: 4'-phosphopantetheinyl transferase superfamily protein [Patescibacteria group bacterium]|nr:4'-phosphopantetheinyl transferase superfamily protein [Patescibacteria group bacterium]
MAIRGVGIDSIEVGRILSFLKKAFSKQELDYASSRGNPASILAGMLAAKEAASKALGVSQLSFFKLEVRFAKDGTPQIWKGKKKLPVCVSLTHTATVASAIAVR